MSLDFADRLLPLGLAEGLDADADDFPFLEAQRFFSRKESEGESTSLGGKKG